ncbi:30S ribosomal subunit protein S13 [Candidatus Zinderia insecticola CARI]|uniref:Small ribosomal subunit protein uS13 n=1 Tax=Zinderia insecticola (strain CARI) TaxID=871271 RepID=E0TJ26_ZINIC|nr:30S ribosomal subunit protein S13 [Candidatus Zinderia insecticola CARI]
MIIRIAGINLPINKNIYISLTKIFGIGINISKKICKVNNIDINKKTKNLNDNELSKIRKEIYKYSIEGELKREIFINIKRLIDIKSYRGIRHILKLPVRGQRTRTNAKTCRRRRKKNKKIFLNKNINKKYEKKNK